VGIFVGSLLSNVIITWQEFPGISLWRAWLPSLGIALGAALEALAAAWFLKNRAGGREFCLSATHATAFVLRVALIPASISALIGPSFLTFYGVYPPEKWLLVVLAWFDTSEEKVPIKRPTAAAPMMATTISTRVATMGETASSFLINLLNIFVSLPFAAQPRSPAYYGQC
jgi:hypothetical protein